MASEIFLLYLLTRLDGINSSAQFFAAISLFVAALSLMIMYTSSNKEGSDYLYSSGVFNKSKWVFIIFASIATFVPTKNDAMFIAAGTGVIEAAKTDTAKRIAGKSVEVVEKYLDGMLNDKKGK